MKLGSVFLFSLLIIWQTLHNAQSLAVMSVDLGSEWMKIAIVSPGVPMEIALNKESKRKTPVIIAFRDGERTFGDDAGIVGIRFPRNSYGYLLDLLGKSLDNPLVQLYQKRFPYYSLEADPERGTVLFRHDSETLYSPEELLAQILHKAKQFAEDSAGQPVKEAVLTVPGYFNQVERKSLLQAAELAGIKVLQLINDYTAVALNYGIFRRKDFNETAQYILFYDMGASSTTATVVSYQLVKTKEKGFTETNPQLSILGIGYDRTLGGLEMQLRLRDYLGRKFNEQKKTTNDVFKNPRALAKLFKEAGRLKNVLSANAEHQAQVEGLLDDVDFKLLVTREHFEDLCSDLFDRIKAPVDQALKSSGLDLSVIGQVILVGAGTRVPKVQERLAAVVGQELGKSLNTDEAAAMGAVYKAADLSTGFKVKKFITRDAVLYPIQVVFERELESSNSVKHVKRMLFGPMNPYPQKKVLTFNKHQTDFSFYVNYGELDHIPENEVQSIGSLNISRIDLTGVAEALSKNTAGNVESKGVKAHFSMDDSGILAMSGVELVLEKTLSPEEQEAEDKKEESPLSKLGSTISKLFTTSEEKDETKEQKEGERDENASSETEKDSSTTTKDETADGDKKVEEEKKVEEGPEETEKSKEDNTKNATKPVEKKPKVVVIKEPIAASEEKHGISSLSEDQFKASLQKIQSLNEFDEQRHRREGALNALESFVFDAQTKLETEEYEKASTAEEVEKIRKACSEIADWLYEDGSDAKAEVYEEKLSELRTLTKPLYRRVKEHQERPEALAALANLLNASHNFLSNARNRTGMPEGEEIFTAVELDTLEKAILDVEEWRGKIVAEQESLKLSDTPKLTIKLISEKMALLDREVKYLINKAKIWKPKKPKTEENEKTPNATEPEKEKNKIQTPEEATEEQQQELPNVDAAENASEQSGEAGDSSLPQPDTNGDGSKLNEGQEDEKSHVEL